MAFLRDIKKSDREIIRVEITKFREEHFLNIRVWYKDKNNQEYKPTQRGIAIRLVHFSEFKEAILAAEEEVQTLLKIVNSHKREP